MNVSWRGIFVDNWYWVPTQSSSPWSIKNANVDIKYMSKNIKTCSWKRNGCCTQHIQVLCSVRWCRKWMRYLRKHENSSCRRSGGRFCYCPWCVLLSSWYPEGVIYWHKPFISLLNTETVTLQNYQFSFRMGSQAQLSCTNSFSINILQIKFRIVNISITFLHPSVSPFSCYRKPGGEIIPNLPVLHF